jgi:hypothetical protein
MRNIITMKNYNCKRGLAMIRPEFGNSGALRVVAFSLLLNCLLMFCGQALPYLDWQRCLGGQGDDYAYSVQQTADDGYILAGGAKSNNGNVSGNRGGYDCWAALLNRNGNSVWQKCLGGSNDDVAQCIQQTAEGGCILAGWTRSSNNGDVSGNHGSVDCWAALLDANGTTRWQKCLGGSY